MGPGTGDAELANIASVAEKQNQNTRAAARRLKGRPV